MDISKLINGEESVLDIDTVIEFPKEYITHPDIKDLSPIKVNGYIKKIDEYYNLDILITGTMTLECARTLKSIEYPINITLNEDITTEENEDYDKIIENSLDIMAIVWENIVLEIPLRVVSDDDIETTSGEGWNLLSEDEVKNTSPLSELSDLLNKEDE